jgi:hypothetical protein
VKALTKRPYGRTSSLRRTGFGNQDPHVQPRTFRFLRASRLELHPVLTLVQRFFRLKPERTAATLRFQVVTIRKRKRFRISRMVESKSFTKMAEIAVRRVTMFIERLLFW